VVFPAFELILVAKSGTHRRSCHQHRRGRDLPGEDQDIRHPQDRRYSQSAASVASKRIEAAALTMKSSTSGAVSRAREVDV
jgi:hypothetical protein